MNENQTMPHAGTRRLAATTGGLLRVVSLLLLPLLLLSPDVGAAVGAGVGAAAGVGERAGAPLPVPEPARRTLLLPTRGFRALDAEDAGPCAPDDSTRWTRGPAGAAELCVSAEGPAGSGRYWTIRVGLAMRAGARPTRGACLVTNTPGWPALGVFRGGALRWLEDLDGDGRVELILWESFPLEADAAPPRQGLVGRVYRVAAGGRLRYAPRLSRALARELAQAYRAPAADADALVLDARARAAAALEAFAAGR